MTVQTFQSIYTVFHCLGVASIYRPLSYPLRSLHVTNDTKDLSNQNNEDSSNKNKKSTNENDEKSCNETNEESSTDESQIEFYVTINHQNDKGSISYLLKKNNAFFVY